MAVFKSLTFSVQAASRTQHIHNSISIGDKKQTTM